MQQAVDGAMGGADRSKGGRILNWWTAKGTPHRRERKISRRGAATAVALSSWVLLVGLLPTGAASASSTSRPGALRVAAVLPVAGDRYAAPGTGITFEGVKASDLGALKVVGSTSGLHTGRLRPLVGGPVPGEVFAPKTSFRPGESVTVFAPGLLMPGGRGDSYTFGVAVPASPAEASRALKLAAVTPAASARPASSEHASAPYSPPPCRTLVYKSEPNLQAQRACMNLGVASTGTQPGNYLFLTPGGSTGDGEGIYEANGDLAWWQASPQAVDHNLSLVHYSGQPYLALWVGAHAGGHGAGSVILYDQHYQVAGEITAGGSYPKDSVDLHEFQITPGGDALVGIYDAVKETINGHSETVLQYVVQELSLLGGPGGIHTGDVLFEWDSLSSVPVSQSYLPDPGSGGVWDYFHGNAISEDTDGNLVVSARSTWGIYKIDATPGDASFGKLMWQVGTKTSNELQPEPWCYQHDIAALGNNEYSLYDDGGAGPGCAGPTSHPARGLLFTVDPNTSPAGVTPVQAYTHNPPIYTAYTGSTEQTLNGDVVIDWANVPEISEYDATGSQLKMDLSLSNFSYRGFSEPWDGQPLTLPSV
ncbi:MAG: arylsulfotransferase family protein, partial [Acidimicrobiales bacterium]